MGVATERGLLIVRMRGNVEEETVGVTTGGGGPLIVKRRGSREGRKVGVTTGGGGPLIVKKRESREGRKVDVTTGGGGPLIVKRRGSREGRTVGVTTGGGGGPLIVKKRESREGRKVNVTTGGGGPLIGIEEITKMANKDREDENHHTIEEDVRVERDSHAHHYTDQLQTDINSIIDVTENPFFFFVKNNLFSSMEKNKSGTEVNYE